MQQEMSRVRLDEMRGAPVYDNDGDKIGKVEEIFYDQQTRVPEWIGIGTGLFGTKRALVPVKGAHVSDDGLVVAYSKQQVKDIPMSTRTRSRSRARPISPPTTGSATRRSVRRRVSPRAASA